MVLIFLAVLGGSADAAAQEDPCVEADLYTGKAARSRARGGPALAAGLVTMAIGGALVAGGSAAGFGAPGGERPPGAFEAGLSIMTAGIIAMPIGVGITIDGSVRLTVAAAQGRKAEDWGFRCRALGRSGLGPGRRLGESYRRLVSGSRRADARDGREAVELRVAGSTTRLSPENDPACPSATALNSCAGRSGDALPPGRQLTQRDP